MITINCEELESFHRCEIYHRKKYIEKEKPVRERTQAGFDGHSNIVIEARDAISQLTDYYFHRLMDDHQPRLKTVIRRWGRIWLKDMTYIDICMDTVPVSRLSKIKVNTATVQNLPRFCATFKKPFQPVIVREEILLPIGSTIISVTVDMAYRTNDGILRIVKFTPYKISPGKPTQDLDLITQACAWMHNSGEDQVEVAYYNMLAPSEYEPMSVGTLTSQTKVYLAKLVEGFQNKKSVNMFTTCKGCEYKCVKEEDESNL